MRRDAVTDASVIGQMEVSLAQSPARQELHRSLLAPVALYARARARLRRRLRADLSDRQMRHVRRRISVSSVAER